MAYEEIIVNDHIRLIQLRPDQADILFRLTDTSRQYLGEFLPWVKHVKSVEDSLKHIEETITNRASNSTYTYGIEFDGEVVGDISLRNLQEVAIDPPEIGYWISKDYAGKGLTTLATQALTSFGLRELGLKEIVIRAETGNTGSNKIAEKSGYVFAKQTKSENNRAINVWIYRGGN